MTREQVHDLMENELRCIQWASTNRCDRDCSKCPLVKDDNELIEAYGYVIKELEQEPRKGEWLRMSDLSEEEAISLLSQVNHILVNSNSWLENTHEPLNIAFNMAIKALEQKSRWIPCSERLPEEGQWVMVTFDGKIAVCIAHDNDGTLREATSLVLKNATEIWLYPESEWGDGYAAWMPLPKPYREVEE